MTFEEAKKLIEGKGGGLRFTYKTGTCVYGFGSKEVAREACAELTGKGPFSCRRSNYEVYLKP